jgi:hypothetical protein
LLELLPSLAVLVVTSSASRRLDGYRNPAAAAMLCPAARP